MPPGYSNLEVRIKIKMLNRLLPTKAMIAFLSILKVSCKRVKPTSKKDKQLTLSRLSFKNLRSVNLLLSTLTTKTYIITLRFQYRLSTLKIIYQALPFLDRPFEMRIIFSLLSQIRKTLVFQQHSERKIMFCRQFGVVLKF